MRLDHLAAQVEPDARAARALAARRPLAGLLPSETRFYCPPRLL